MTAAAATVADNSGSPPLAEQDTAPAEHHNERQRASVRKSLLNLVKPAVSLRRGGGGGGTTTTTATNTPRNRVDSTTSGISASSASNKKQRQHKLWRRSRRWSKARPGEEAQVRADHQEEGAGAGGGLAVAVVGGSSSSSSSSAVQDSSALGGTTVAAAGANTAAASTTSTPVAIPEETEKGKEREGGSSHSLAIGAPTAQDDNITNEGQSQTLESQSPAQEQSSPNVMAPPQSPPTQAPTNVQAQATPLPAASRHRHSASIICATEQEPHHHQPQFMTTTMNNNNNNHSEDSLSLPPHPYATASVIDDDNLLHSTTTTPDLTTSTTPPSNQPYRPAVSSIQGHTRRDVDGHNSRPWRRPSSTSQLLTPQPPATSPPPLPLPPPPPAPAPHPAATTVGNRQFPPPGTLVVVQGIVHTTDISRSNNNSTTTASNNSNNSNNMNSANPIPSGSGVTRGGSGGVENNSSTIGTATAADGSRAQSQSQQSNRALVPSSDYSGPRNNRLSALLGRASRPASRMDDQVGGSSGGIEEGTAGAGQVDGNSSLEGGGGPLAQDRSQQQESENSNSSSQISSSSIDVLGTLLRFVSFPHLYVCVLAYRSKCPDVLFFFFQSVVLQLQPRRLLCSQVRQSQSFPLA